MKRTYLVQKLDVPVQGKPGYKNPFAPATCLSETGLHLLSSAFDFHFMGAAEYEWGAIPEALRSIWQEATKNNVVARAVEIAPPPQEEGDRQNPLLKTVTFYILAPKELEPPARDFLMDQTGPRKLALRDRTGIKEAFGEESRPRATRGWLELDNGFFVFADYEMFAQTAKIFDVPHNIPAPQSPTAVTRDGVQGRKPSLLRDESRHD